MDNIDNNDILNKLVEGKVVYFLAIVALVQFIYPITASGNPYTIVIYHILYASMIIVGIMLAHDTITHLIILIVSGVLFLVLGAVYVFYPNERWASFLSYLSIIPFQATLIYVLLRFIFISKIVTRDVLYAASSVYLLLGSIFVPIYGFLETLCPGSFVDGSTPDKLVYWQQFIYYSYVTLTTVGYGDILPVTLWARSIATFEAVIGVLYITVIMARLVGLYAAKEL